MTTNETDRLTAVLRAKHAQLSGVLLNRNEIAIEKAPDALDEVQQMAERELAIRTLDRDSNLLRLVSRALSRIARGAYGVCLHCEEDISSKRIAAVPWTAFCIRCQEKIDRQEIYVNENGAQLETAA